MRFVLLSAALLALVLSASGAETVVCTIRRAEAQKSSENDGLGGNRIFSVAQLPWLVIPSGVPDPAPEWIDQVLLARETLLEFQLPNLEIGAVSVRSSCRGSDYFAFGWHGTTYAKSFAQFSTSCNYIYPQQFGIDSHSSLRWGSDARTVRDGSVFGPTGG